MIKDNENTIGANLSEIVALKCGLYPSGAKRIRTAATLHDIGKTKIPDSILNKPGKLDRSEFEIMKMHTKYGAEILSHIQGGLGDMLRTVCLYHHEWYNGRGGYWGRYTCDLPMYASIVSIADVFAALLSTRIYKAAWPPEDAVEYIRKQSGTQFNPMLVESFLSLVHHDKRVAELFICQ